MLTALSIHNIILIEQLSLDFQQGLSIFSGETGAGKSILLESLMLALGGRGDTQVIRQGAPHACVCATFEISHHKNIIELLKEQDVFSEEPLALRRTIHPDGRSKAFINDHPVSIGLLRKIGERLIEIHGQFDQLLEPVTHRQILDMFAGHMEKVQEVKQAYFSWQDIEKKYQHYQQRQQQLSTQEIYLRQVIEELETVNPQPGEETLLVGQKAIQANYHKFKTSLSAAENLLVDDNSVYQAQRILIKLLNDLDQVEGELPAKNTLEQTIVFLDSSLCEQEEALKILQSLNKETMADPQSLEQIEERLHEIRSLARKHRCLPDALPEFYQQLKKDINAIENGDQTLNDLLHEKANRFQFYQQQAQRLSKSRSAAALLLDEKVNQELPLLKLPVARFKTVFDPLPEETISEGGLERVEFLVQTNPDTLLGGLGKIASGGERARFMLAIKVALAGKGSVPTLVFDEIDAGTGGAVAAALGNRLHCLGQHLQLLVITHAPQVAALATHHFHVSKFIENGKTITQVQKLTPPQRIEEIARMLSGEHITDQARQAAMRLMQHPHP